MNSEIKALFEEEGYSIITDESETSGDDEKGASGAALLKYGNGYSLPSGEGKKVPESLPAEKTHHKKAEILPFRAPDKGDYDIPTIVQYLNWHMNRINENVIGRDDIIRQAFFAILTGEHMLLLSRTGMAKSYLTNYIFNIFEGARIFSAQASKDQTPDNYFGPYNIEEFKKGKIRHNIKGSIIESNLVFIDEFFDASDVVLRSLLSVLNERKFINGQEQIDVSIHTAVATANYMRLNEVTEAVLDRFTYKSIIPEDNNLYSQLLIDHTYRLNKGKPVEPERKIFFDQVLYLSDIVRNNNKDIKIEISDYIYFLKNVVVNKFVSEMRKIDGNFFVSPRKRAKLSDLLRAYALTKNRRHAERDDLRELYLALCTLNSHVSSAVNAKSEKDIFLDAYQQVMIHFDTTGANQQIQLLLNIRKVFQELREDPEKRAIILKKKGFVRELRDILMKIFPAKRKNDNDEITIESLKKNVFDIDPAVEEVRELKDGILKDYQDLY